MKPYSASLINAGVMIAAGTWDYLVTNELSLASLMPFTAGLALLLLNGGLRRENKIIAHIVVVLTLLVALFLLIPLVSSIGRPDGMAVLRIVFMILSAFLALIFFIRSFIQARENRQQ